MYTNVHIQGQVATINNLKICIALSFEFLVFESVLSPKKSFCFQFFPLGKYENLLLIIKKIDFSFKDDIEMRLRSGV
jgi:hypothetical protein